MKDKRVLENNNKSVFGWGIVDVNYKLQEKTSYRINGVTTQKLDWICPYYSDWREMIRRVHGDSWRSRYITYADVSILEEWQYLSNFIKWVDSQPNKDWENYQLDKDLLGDGKIYSPLSCAYVSSKTNSFVIDAKNSRGTLMIGVATNIESNIKPYRAACGNPFTRKRVYLGSYSTELEAHKAWQAKKHEFACQLADLQEDPRVAEALRQRYSPDKDWNNR